MEMPASSWLPDSAQMDQDNVSSKDAALRAVGRTVVNFQRLEHNLKIAARLGPLQGTALKVQRDIEKRSQRASALTLGQAIQAWLDACEGEPRPTSHTPDLFDATMRVTFCLDMEADTHGGQAATLRSLLDTRNQLMHGGLAKFDWDSTEECHRLVMQLDELNQSIAAQIEYVHSILDAFRSTCREHVEMLHAMIERDLASGHRSESDG